MGWFMDQVNRFICYTNREPILKIRRILWMVTSGWWLALLYGFSAIAFIFLIVFIPFGIKALKFPLFAFDPVTKEAYFEASAQNTDIRDKPLKGAWYWYAIAANVVWLVTVGWALALGHLMTAIFAAMTIIGLGTAWTNIRLMLFAAWPFTQAIRETYLPTTLDEWKRHEDTITEMTQRKQGAKPQFGNDVV